MIGNPYGESETLVLRDFIPLPHDYHERRLRARSESPRRSHSPGKDKYADEDVPKRASDLHVSDDQTQAATVESVLEVLFPPVEVDSAEGPLLSVASQYDVGGRMSAVNLQEQLEKRLKERFARPGGVCPVRDKLYTECFDEVIRQTTIDCPERGVLLAILRDELSETQSSYELLMGSTCQFAMRKTIERDLSRTMAQQLAELQTEVAIVDNRVSEIKAKYEGIDKRFQERRAAEEKKHAEEVAFLKKGNTQLTNEIKRLTT